MESCSLTQCADALLAGNYAKMSLEDCLAKIQSADACTFFAHENDTERILHNLLKIVAGFCRTENCTGVLAIVLCLHKANSNDKFAITGAEIVLPELVNLLPPLLVRIGLIETESIFPAPTNCILGDLVLPFSRQACISIAERLFELALDYFDVVSKSTELHFHRLADIVAEFLFHQKRVEPSNCDMNYSIDCLSRYASYVLYNVADTFPSSHSKLYNILKPRAIKLLRLSCNAPESSIRRSLIRVASLLYRSRKRGLLQFKDIRRAYDNYLRDNFDDNVRSLFNTIDSKSEAYEEQVENFRECISGFPTMNQCFVTPSCVVTITSGKKLELDEEVRNVDWDERSFVIRLEGQESKRFPYCFVTGILWKGSELHITTEVPNTQTKKLRVKFTSSLAQDTDIGARVKRSLQSRIRGLVTTDLSWNRERKISQAFDAKKPEISKLKNASDTNARTLFTALSGDGTLLSKDSNDLYRRPQLRSGQVSFDFGEEGLNENKTLEGSNCNTSLESRNCMQSNASSKQLCIEGSSLSGQNLVEASWPHLSTINPSQLILATKQDPIYGSTSLKNNLRTVPTVGSASNGSRNQMREEATAQSEQYVCKNFECYSNEELSKEGITHIRCAYELNTNSKSDDPKSTHGTDNSSLNEHVSHVPYLKLYKMSKAQSSECSTGSDGTSGENCVLLAKSKDMQCAMHDMERFKTASDGNVRLKAHEPDQEHIYPSVRPIPGKKVNKFVEKFTEPPESTYEMLVASGIASGWEEEEEEDKYEIDFFVRLSELLDTSVKVRRKEIISNILPVQY